VVRNRAKYVIAAEMVLTTGRNGDNALMIVKRWDRGRLVPNGGGPVLVELVGYDVLIGCGSILVEMIGGQSSQLKGPGKEGELFIKTDFPQKIIKHQSCSGMF
jgi:hypothetical protein